MMIKKICFVIASFGLFAVNAQTDIPFDKNTIADKQQLKEAIDALKSGNRLFEKGGLNYPAALAEYEKAYRINPDNAHLNMVMGVCHLNGNDRTAALPFFEKAKQLDPNTPRIDYLLGMGHQLNANWDDAIASFNQHLKVTGGMQDVNPFFNKAHKHIQECRSGKKLAEAASGIRIEHLGIAVNTEAPEYGAIISPDGKEMYFTSRREGSTGGKLDPGAQDYFEDIYYCRSENGKWSDPVQLPSPVNTPGNDATIGLFNDGSTLLMYRDKGGTGDIYQTTRNGDSWSTPVSIGDQINTDYHESSAWFSFDRKWLYFVSDRPDLSMGGTDIFRSAWDEEKQAWGMPENLGAPINTVNDEDGIFVHPDGKTIYFSSTGHNSMGGFDVFTSESENGIWSDPENLGLPINSPDDDVFFVVTADGSKGYFSSVRSGGSGEDDIYVAHLFDDSVGDATASEDGAGEMDDQWKKDVILISGEIKDSQTDRPLDADIELFDLRTGEIIATFNSRKTNGAYSFAVPSDSEYGLNVKSEGHLFHSEFIELPHDDAYAEFLHNIDLKALDIGNSIVLNNIFFDYDRSELRKSSTGELKNVLRLMKENPGLVLEISGHTDSDGSSDYNKGLSERRAKAVKDWLVGKGTDDERVQAVGYGESKPASSNTTEAGKAKNRRTELKVIKN